jgi:hypothetical protein
MHRVFKNKHHESRKASEYMHHVSPLCTMHAIHERIHERPADVPTHKRA